MAQFEDAGMIVVGYHPPVRHQNTSDCNGTAVYDGACATCGEPARRVAHVTNSGSTPYGAITGTATVTVAAPAKKCEPTPWKRKFAAYTPRACETERSVVRPEFRARSNPRR